jgi:type IV pilus assembly protein PilE
MISHRSTLFAYQGMTLIEMMIVIALVGIVSAIAYPSYQKHLVKSERSHAQGNLLTMQLYLEQHYNPANTSFISGYDFGVVSDGQCSVCTHPSKGYEFQILSAAVYTLQAKSTQSNEVSCRIMSVTQAGVFSPQSCW